MTFPNSTAEILKTEFGHIKLEGGQITCAHCKDVSKAPARAMSLANHIYTFFGFVNLHKDCKPGGKSIWKNEPAKP
jgi:hypothetical protein